MSFKYVKRATPKDKETMLEFIRDENEFEKKHPNYWSDEDFKYLPVVYKLERKSDCYQMSAYVNGKIIDNSYHESFVRCGQCNTITLLSDTTVSECTKCYHDLWS